MPDKVISNVPDILKQNPNARKQERENLQKNKEVYYLFFDFVEK